MGRGRRRWGRVGVSEVEARAGGGEGWGVEAAEGWLV